MKKRPMSATDLTMYLQRYAQGEEEALEEMLPFVYQHLRNLARNIRREKGATPTLNTTALVHEAYLKLVQQATYENRLHFFRVAARAMRQIVFTYAEHQQAQKRGGKEADLSLEGIELALPDHRWEEALSIEQGLRQLEQLQPRQGLVVECRFFGGMSVEETAKALSLSSATVKRDWNLARAWLYRFLQEDQASPT
jgi:RNA polymerase sigma factor (TIGR02999 family)